MTDESAYPISGSFAVLHGTVNSLGQQVSMWAERGGDDVAKRAIGCWMLFIMPEEGVDEALTSLKEMVEYHYETSRGILSPPAKTLTQRGRIVGTAERPDLIISE
ncbi:MAG: hypothetical protein Q8Q00_02270 [Dehalococcoidia bacterium]|nr:hypothetical protein [Dehalococcoidia bacterium]